jgi:hypothetical protein
MNKLTYLGYRPNILNFPGNPAGASNLGLLDQRAAAKTMCVTSLDSAATH